MLMYILIAVTGLQDPLTNPKQTKAYIAGNLL